MELKTKRKIIEEMNISFWKSMEKEDEEKKAQLELSNKINNTLTECLQFIERVSISKLPKLWPAVLEFLNIFLKYGVREITSV